MVTSSAAPYMQQLPRYRLRQSTSSSNSDEHRRDGPPQHVTLALETTQPVRDGPHAARLALQRDRPRLQLRPNLPCNWSVAYRSKSRRKVFIPPWTECPAARAAERRPVTSGSTSSEGACGPNTVRSLPIESTGIE